VTIEITPDLLEAVADHVQMHAQGAQGPSIAAGVIRDVAKDARETERTHALVDALAAVHFAAEVEHDDGSRFVGKPTWKQRGKDARLVSRAAMRTALNYLVDNPCKLPKGGYVINAEEAGHLRMVCEYAKEYGPKTIASSSAMRLEQLIGKRGAL
jgi:hypothetical protein